MFDVYEYIWVERKRYLGLPISFTKYMMTPDRIFVQTGFFSMKREQILFQRVKDLTLTATLWQRFFGVGSVHIISADASTPQMHLVNIPDPAYVMELIHKNSEKIRKELGLKLNEFQ